MATPVKIIPTLHGKTAKTFLERAEKLERRSEELRLQGKTPHPASIYTDSEEAAYIRMMRKSGMPL